MLFNPKLQETSGSSVTQQSAVQQPNIVGGIAQAVGQVSSIFSEVSKAKEKGATNNFLDQFTSDLTRISNREQQDPNFSSNDANSAVERLYTKAISNPRGRGSVMELGKIRNSINQVTGSFDEFETPEQKMKDKVFEGAMAEFYIKSGDTQEQIQLGLSNYAQDQITTRKLNLMKLEEQVLKTKNDRISQGRLKDLKAQQIEDTKIHINSSRAATLTDLEDIYEKGVKGDMLASEVQRLIGKRFAVYKNNVLSFGADPTWVNSMIQPLQDQVNTLTNLADGKVNASQAANQNELAVSRAKTLALTTPEVLKFLVKSEIFKNNPSAQSSLAGDAADLLVGLKRDKTTTDVDSYGVPPLIGRKGLSNLTEVLSGVSKVANSPTTEVDTKPLQEELELVNNNILKSISQYKDSVKDATEYGEVINYLASPAYEKIVTNGQQNAEDAQDAESAMVNNYAKVLMPSIKSKLDKEFRTIVGSIPFLGDKVENIRDLVDVEYTRVGIIYKVKPDIFVEEKQKKALNDSVKSLNDTVAKSFNKWNKVSSLLLGNTDYSKNAKLRYETAVEGRLSETVKDTTERDKEGFEKGFNVERALSQSGLGNLAEFYFDGVLPKAAQSGFFALAETLSKENVQKLFASILPENDAQKAFREYEESQKVSSSEPKETKE
jgi:autonomous glycyl radical cofactor GrcA